MMLHTFTQCCMMLHVFVPAGHHLTSGSVPVRLLSLRLRGEDGSPLMRAVGAVTHPCIISLQLAAHAAGAVNLAAASYSSLESLRLQPSTLKFTPLPAPCSLDVLKLGPGVHVAPLLGQGAVEPDQRGWREQGGAER